MHSTQCTALNAQQGELPLHGLAGNPPLGGMMIGLRPIVKRGHEAALNGAAPDEASEDCDVRLSHPGHGAMGLEAYKHVGGCSGLVSDLKTRHRNLVQGVYGRKVSMGDRPSARLFLVPVSTVTLIDSHP